MLVVEANCAETLSRRLVARRYLTGIVEAIRQGGERENDACGTHWMLQWRTKLMLQVNPRKSRTPATQKTRKNPQERCCLGMNRRGQEERDGEKFVRKCERVGKVVVDGKCTNTNVV